jgi:hypothetical protein
MAIPMKVFLIGYHELPQSRRQLGFFNSPFERTPGREGQGKANLG